MFHLFSGRARRCSFWVSSWEAASLLQIYCYCRWGWWFWWTPSNFCPIKWGNRDPCSDSQLKAFVSSLSFLLALSLSSYHAFSLSKLSARTDHPQASDVPGHFQHQGLCMLFPHPFTWFFPPVFEWPVFSSPSVPGHMSSPRAGTSLGRDFIWGFLSSISTV